MIFSNVELHKALNENRLVIDPEPLPRYAAVGVHCPYGTHSVDLRLGNEIAIPNAGVFVYDHTQPGKLSEHISRHSEKHVISDRTPFKLERDQFVLGITHERVHLPIEKMAESCLAARIEGKSSRARCGLLIHFTAPTVHPGFEGRLVLEIINLGPSPILLTPGMYIAQLIVEEVKGNSQRRESERVPGTGFANRRVRANRASRAGFVNWRRPHFLKCEGGVAGTVSRSRFRFACSAMAA